MSDTLRVFDKCHKSGIPFVYRMPPAHIMTKTRSLANQGWIAADYAL